LSIFRPVSVPRSQFGVGAWSQTSGEVAVTFAPCVVTVVSAGWVATPEPVSVADQSTRTFDRYQPAALGEVVGLPVIVGGVVSPVGTAAGPPGSTILPSAVPSESPSPPSVKVMSMRQP
jgi:hypothetical protein